VGDGQPEGDGLKPHAVGEQVHDLGIAEHGAGRSDRARQRLEESTQLRREIGFGPGVAANLIGLTNIAAAQGPRDEALAMVEEAGAIAEANAAHAIVRQVEQARAFVWKATRACHGSNHTVIGIGGLGTPTTE